MLVASALRPSIHWGTRLLGAQLRSGAFFRAGLAAVALVVAGRVFDLFAFTPDPIRAGLLGSQTGAFVGVLWAIGTPTALGAYRDPDDGWSMTLRSSLAGASGLWWGAWGAQIITGGALLLLSVVSTIVFSTLTHSPVGLPFAALASGFLAVLLPALIASAVAVWAGGVLGALAGLASFALGQVGAFAPLAALGPTPVAATLDAGDVGRAAALGVAAVAGATAGLRRLRL